MSRLKFDLSFNKQENDFELIKQGLASLHGKEIATKSANIFMYSKEPHANYEANNRVTVQQTDKAIRISIDAPFQHHSRNYLTAALSKFNIQTQLELLSQLKEKMAEQGDKNFVEAIKKDILAKTVNKAKPLNVGDSPKPVTNALNLQKNGSALAQSQQIKNLETSLHAESNLSVKEKIDDKINRKQLQEFYLEEIRKQIEVRNSSRKEGIKELTIEDFMEDKLLHVGIGKSPNYVEVTIGKNFDAHTKVVSQETVEQMLIAARSFQTARNRAAELVGAKEFKGFDLTCETQEQAAALYQTFKGNGLLIKSIKFPGQEAASPEIALMTQEQKAQQQAKLIAEQQAKEQADLQAKQQAEQEAAKGNKQRQTLKV